MSFLLSLFGFFQVLTMQVQWTFDWLDIPLFGNLSDYVELPTATLFINGNIVYDPEMYYVRNGVERTFISTVNTKVVKSYHIKYRVHFPSYYQSYTHTIVFNIYDDIPPEFLALPNRSIPIGAKLPNLFEGVIVSDNYDKISELIVTAESHQVVLSKIGRYPITYRVKDLSGNVSVAVAYLEIYDEIAPEITLKKEPIISYRSIFKVNDFFQITDNYDKMLTITLDDHMVDYDKLGSYPIQVEAIDSSGNVTRFNHYLTIIDTVKPVIKMKSTIPHIPYGTEVTRETLLSYVLSISDDYDELNITDLKAYHDIEALQLGEYMMFYELCDLSFNCTEVKQKVRVSDQVKPVITPKEPLIFEVHSREPFLRNYIDVTDNHTLEEWIQVKFTTSYKMNLVGSYVLTIEATDQSQNKAILQTFIEVVDTTRPELIQLEDILITNFEKKNLTHYFKASDNYTLEKDIIITVDDSKVSYDTVGIYPIEVIAKDGNANQIILMSEVIIIDIEPPILKLTHHVFKRWIGSEPIDLKENIELAYDAQDGLSVLDVIIDGVVDYNRIGRYEITYHLTDQSKNYTTENVIVFIEDHRRPVVSAPNVYIKLNENYDLMKDIELESYGKDIVIKSYPETLDTTKPGSQIITYVAIDHLGNYTTFERTIYIEKPIEKHTIKSFIPMGVVTIMSVAAITYVYKKM